MCGIPTSPIKSVEGTMTSVVEHEQRHAQGPLKSPGMTSFTSQVGFPPFHLN